MHRRGIVRSMATTACANLGHAKFARWSAPALACFVYMLHVETQDQHGTGVDAHWAFNIPAQTTWSMGGLAPDELLTYTVPVWLDLRSSIAPVMSSPVISPLPLVMNGLGPEVWWIKSLCVGPSRLNWVKIEPTFLY